MLMLLRSLAGPEDGSNGSSKRFFIRNAFHLQITLRVFAGTLVWMKYSVEMLMDRFDVRKADFLYIW